jgi:hypothetical protein
MSAQVEVTAPIAEGTLVVLRGVHVADQETWESVVEQMGHVAGHDRFLVLCFPEDGEVELWGPDTDLRERVGVLLAEARRPEPPRRPGDVGAAGWQGPRHRPAPPPARS